MHIGESLEELHHLGAEQLLRAGEYLWQENETGHYAVLIVSGVLEVLNGEGDDRILLRTLGPGNFAGEMSVLDGSPRSASVRARTDSLVLRFRDTDFRQLIRLKPLLLERLFWEQVQRVRTLTQQVGQKHRKSITDPLTRLYNYGFFRERLDMEIERARATADSVVIVLFDIDHFKVFNDSYGHESGNEILVKVADVLRETARRGDVVARYGGEEFVALLYGSTREEALSFAQRVRQRIESLQNTTSHGESMSQLTISGGIAKFPDDAEDGQSLIEIADQNLYLAKQDGRNRIHWYSGEVAYRGH